MKIASIAFTENGAKIVKMLVHEMDVKGYVFEKYKTDGFSGRGIQFNSWPCC